MAITGFGVTELNLIGSSGTPKIESPNNLNLNAVTVAISTNATVGGTLGVTGASTLSGNVAISTDLNVSGISTFVGIISATNGSYLPDGKKITFGTGAGGVPDLSIYSNGSSGVIETQDGGTIYIKDGSNNLVTLSGASNQVDFHKTTLFIGNSKNVVWDHPNDSFYFSDNAKAVFGQGDGFGVRDLSIYSDGTNGIIETQDIGTILIKDGSNTMATFSGSTNNINLNAVTVAISTNATVGGILTATSFSGGGNDIVTSRWTIGANGSSDYTFTGPGGLSGANDPTIYLARGQTYEFVNNSGGSHPFQIRVSNGGSAYSTGVTNNGASSGTIKFEVPFAAPNTLVYQCTAHSGMVGNIVVYPSV